MKAPTNFHFGEILAYLLPGFVGVLALAYVSPRVATFLDGGVTKDLSAGALFGLLLVSLTVGLVISAERALILDWLQLRSYSKRELDYGRLIEEGTLAAFNATINNVYRFSQFYGNMCVATVMLTVLKVYNTFVNDTDWMCTLCNHMVLLILLAASIPSLFFAHRAALRSTHDKLAQIIPRIENGHD